MFANITYTPIEGLDIKYLFSSNTYNQVRGYYETQQHKSTWKDGKNGYASRGSTRSNEDLSELTVQWRKTIFEDHSFTLLGGYSWQKTHYQNFYMQNFNFPSNDYTYNNMGTGQALKDGRGTEYSTANESKLIGYFGRLNYSYKGKYMFAASLRHEGSTKFGADHKWGNFPSVSAAWNIKGEQFLEDTDVLSILKLRAGYGVTGTVPSDPYMSLNTLNFGTYVYYNNQWIKTIRPDSNANPELRWEKKKEINIGVDFGFWEDRITGNIDYYNRKTEDLLWDYDVLPYGSKRRIDAQPRNRSRYHGHPCPNKRFPMDDIHELLDKQKRTFVTFQRSVCLQRLLGSRFYGRTLTNDNPPHSGRTTDW